MKKLYSYHESKEVMMLDEDEWNIVDPTPYYSMDKIQNYRAKTGCSLQVAFEECETYIQQKYYELTGIKELLRLSWN
jgi:hypothetical protein